MKTSAQSNPSVQIDPAASVDDANLDTGPVLLTTAHDPSFDQLFDISLLAEAIAQQDIFLMTDLALQMQHAESVLQRPHPGLPAADLLTAAMHLATQLGDQASLQRLRTAAERSGNVDLVEQLDLAVKLAAASRSTEASEVVVSLAEVTPERFAAYRALLSDIEQAAFLADADGLKVLSEQVAHMKGLSESQRTELNRELQRAEQHVVQVDPGVQAALNRLSLISRQFKLPPLPVPPGIPLADPGPVSMHEQAHGYRSVKISVTNRTPYVISVARSLKPSSGTWYPNNTKEGWSVLEPGETRYLGNNWGRHFYCCAVATTKRNPKLSRSKWWSGSEMQGQTVGTLRVKGFRDVDLGSNWRSRASATIRVE